LGLAPISKSDTTPAHAEASKPAIELRGVTKRFPGVLALDDVSLTVWPGEIHAIIGQNGAGKSTMINVISGMIKADAGSVLLSGQAVTIDSTRAAIEHGIATVYQELSLLPNLNVMQNIALGREPRRAGFLDIQAMRRAAASALERIGLAIAIETPLGSLSLAERQLVEIAKALANRPSVLVLDEPTAALAGREAERLFAILKGLRAPGIAIVYVSHRFREILDLCDRATVLRNGRAVTTTDLQDLTEADLTEAMVGSRAEIYGRRSRQVSGSIAMECRGLYWRDRVSDVGFSVAEGKIVALTGLLGAGQNEIARMVGGDLKPDRGEIIVKGRPVALNQPRDGVKSGICLLTDERKVEGILPNLSLRENIALPSLGARLAAGIFVNAAAERRAVVGETANFGIVARSTEVPMRTLSGGNQQKALIARWHLDDAQVFVLIEPTYGVDVAARAEIYRRIEALAAAGKALVIVSSDAPEILALADRILVIRKGSIVAETRPADSDEERLNLMIQGAR
jgi:ABC-type sugar transport system ATPase subunit